MGFGRGEGYTPSLGAISKEIDEALTIPMPTLSEVQTDLWIGGLLSVIALVVPIPSISLATAEDHSGGGGTATPALTIPVPTVGGVAALVE